MSVHIVRLGTPRRSGEGLRIGTVRRPPRGVRREDYARGDWYDVWLPLLAPSAEDVRAVRASPGEAAWRRFARRYLADMRRPGPRHVLDTLAALARHTDLAVGCYCADEARCHRSLLRRLFEQRGAETV